MVNTTAPAFTDVFVERSVIENTGRHYGCMPVDGGAGCLSLYKVEWLESLVGIEDGRLLCHFRAPDAESVRLALRNNGTPFDALWAGAVLETEQAGGGSFAVEFNFARPASEDTEALVKELGEECLKTHRFKLRRVIVSRDRMRVLCLCEAIDGFVPYHSQVWPFLRVCGEGGQPVDIRH